MKSPYYSPETTNGGINLLIILFFLMLVSACVIIIFNSNLDWKSKRNFCLIALGVFVFILIILLCTKGIQKKNYLVQRGLELQKILDDENKNYLRTKRCHAKVGPLGSYLKFIFTVKIFFYDLAYSTG